MVNAEYLVIFVSILGAVFSLGGNILIMLKKRSGWIMWIFGNIMWILYNFITDFNLPMVLMYAVYLLINIIGFIKWKDET